MDKVNAYFNINEDKYLDVSEFKKTRVGVYGIAVKDKKIQVVRVHPSGEENVEKVYLEKPLWDFPGGGIDPGENVIDALKREFKEEVGVEPVVGRLWHVGQAHYCNAAVPMTNVQVYYFVELKNDNFNPSRESLEASWQDPVLFSRENSLPGLYQVLDKVKKELI